MSVLCGIDFSESSFSAAVVGARLAARLGVGVHLVHALAEWPGGDDSHQPEAFIASARRGLDESAKRLSKEGAPITVGVAPGPPEETLGRYAAQHGCQLIVVGATGRGKPRGRAIGGRADRIGQQSRVPVLVVRDIEPFERWLSAAAPLKVLVGLDFGLVSDQAFRWAASLARAGTIDLVGLHLYWPPSEYARLGLEGIRSYVEVEPGVDRVLRHELEERFVSPPGSAFRLRVEPSLGSPADHLVQIANDEQAHLLVAGSHQRGMVSRLWEGSVSRGVLHHARCSVALVPLEGVERARRTVPKLRAVLAATDFSPLGNAAVGYAYAQVGATGKVHLVHVVPPARGQNVIEPHDIFTAAHAEAAAKLRALIPAEAPASATEVHVLESKDAPHAIVQASERLSVDVLCLGTHGRTGLHKGLLGSIAQAVLAQTERPLLLVRLPRE